MTTTMITMLMINLAVEIRMHNASLSCLVSFDDPHHDHHHDHRHDHHHDHRHDHHHDHHDHHHDCDDDHNIIDH